MAGFTKFDQLTVDVIIDQTHGFSGWLGVTRFFPEQSVRDRLRESLENLFCRSWAGGSTCLAAALQKIISMSAMPD